MGSLCPYRQQRGLLIFFRSAGLQLTLALLFCSVALSRDLYAQEPLERKVTIALKNVTLEKALTELERAAHVKFVYSRSRVKVNVLVAVDATDKKLSDVLKELLEPRGIDFSASTVKEQILLYLHVDGPPKTGELNQLVPDNQQQPSQGFRADITGTVLDVATQQPLPGVNVIVRGTTNGTSTNADGKYSLTAADNDILVFSFIGYKPFETNVAGRILIDVSLESDVTALQEVVINAGYYDVKEKEKTGSISKVTAAVIEKQPITNPLGALQGRMPGVYIEQTMGIPGGDFNIQIRGQNSLRRAAVQASNAVDGNQPLYVVDGVPFSMDKVSAGEASQSISQGVSPLTSLNPNDIESIEILKDADATAIYGSRGSNGVVLITTKKGKAGKTKFDLNYYMGFGRAPNVEVLNTQQYLAMRREAFANDGITIYPANAYDVNGTWDTTRYTNWNKIMTGNIARVTSIQGSVSGGSENTQFLFSTGYRKEGSPFPGDFAYQKFSSHLSLNHKSADKNFFINITTSGTLDRNNQVSHDFTAVGTTLPPNAPEIYDENNNLNWEGNTWTNPFAALEREYDGRVGNLVSNVISGYEIINGLTLKSSFGFTTIQSREFHTVPSTSFPPIEGQTSANSYVITGNGSNQSWIIEPQLTYNKTISKGILSILIGSTVQEQQFEKLASQYRNFSSNSMMGDLSSASLVFVHSSAKYIYRYAAFFSRANFNWDGKYIINLTARRDGSSRFGPGKQFASFGAIGGAWIFSNESLIKDNFSFLSFGKLRASYGITGSDQIGNYQFLDTYSAGAVYQGTKGLTPSRLYNPDFAWEENHKLEAAIELGFINDRILLNTNYYRNRSSNQLVNYTVPMTTGFSGILSNLQATVQNTGVEFELKTVNIQRNFSWSTSLNFTVPKNKLIDFPNLETSTFANTYVVGESIYIRKYYKSTGVNPETGLYTFKDYNSDGVLTDNDDRKSIVFVGQRFFGGFNNSISYKGLQLDVFFQFVKQTGYNYKFQSGYYGPASNIPLAGWESIRWRQPGDVAETQRLATETNDAAYRAGTFYSQVSDAIIGDASFIRCKNIALSYTLPAAWLKRFVARLYLQGQNLFVITKYKGYDPETQVSRLGPLRMLTMGVQFTL